MGWKGEANPAGPSSRRSGAPGSIGESGSIEPEELLSAIDAGSAPVILDVRSRWEFLRGRVPGAVHVPFWMVMAGVRMPPDAPVVIYCGHGPRAWMAGTALRGRGFTRISYLNGHWAAWSRAGLRQER